MEKGFNLIVFTNIGLEFGVLVAETHSQHILTIASHCTTFRPFELPSD